MSITQINPNPNVGNNHERSHSDEINEFIKIAKESYSFQTKDVLQTIVQGEQRRINQEQAMWRIGGAVLGVCLGLGDGFQPRDVFLGMGFSSIAGMAHESMSQRDRKFLEDCKSLWLVGNNSPIELAQRIGPAKSRILMYDENANSPFIFNHHISHRGEHLVPLFSAGDMASGFSSYQSLEVLNRYISPQNIDILKGQLYPHTNGTQKINSLNQISKNQAHSTAAFTKEFLEETQPVLISTTDYGTLVGYEIPIPAHSDF